MERERAEPDEDHAREAYEQLAIMVAVTARLSAECDHELLPSERPDTPEHWISNLAEGCTRDLPLSHTEAIAGIRDAFAAKYGMTPEAYLEQMNAGNTPVRGQDDSRDKAIRKAAQLENGPVRDRDPGRDDSRER